LYCWVRAGAGGRVPRLGACFPCAPCSTTQHLPPGKGHPHRMCPSAAMRSCAPQARRLAVHAHLKLTRRLHAPTSGSLYSSSCWRSPQAHYIVPLVGAWRRQAEGPGLSQHPHRVLFHWDLRGNDRSVPVGHELRGQGDCG